MNKSEAKDLVTNGVRVLDEQVPGWWRVINLEELQMADCSVCMLGQLFGHDTETALGAKMFGLPVDPKLTQKVKRYGRLHSGVPRADADIRFYVDNPHLVEELGFTRGREILKTNGASIGCGSDPLLKCAWAEVIAERRAELEIA